MNRLIAAAILVCHLVSLDCLFAEVIPVGLEAQVDAVAEELIHGYGAPGLSIAVAIENKLVYAKGYGSSDIENGVQVSTETRFRTASIAKSLTAVMVLALAEKGVLDLDAPVQKYVPEFPEKEWPVTSRQLLCHLGGVRHYQSNSESASKQHFESLTDALKVFSSDPLRHQPGSKFLYSTFGYNLLGAVAEGAAGQSFMTLLHQLVLEPSNMALTVEDSHSAIITGRSRGYSKVERKLRSTGANRESNRDEHIQNAPLHDTSMKIPGGGLLSTPSDLVQFAVAVNSGKLLSPEGCRQMWTRQTKLDGTAIAYGLGWRIGQHDGWKMVSHSGGQAGTSTLLVLFPETGTSVAIMCNLQNVSLISHVKRIASLIQAARKTPADYRLVVDKLRSAVEYEVAAKQIPSFAISLVHGDKLVWASGFGFQDADQSVPASADTIYRFGSISKLFTSVAVMKAVEQERLHLDTTLKDIIPNWNPQDQRADSLTLRQLMSHRSGLVREPPIGNYFDPTEPTLLQTLESLNSSPLVYKPNSKTKYSNAAFALIGVALENAWSTDFSDVIRREIFQPLDMQRSSFRLSPAAREQTAEGWMRTVDGRRFLAPKFSLGTGPAGNLTSSVEDLSKFLSWMLRVGGLENNELLRPENFGLLTTPVTDTVGKQLDYGLGFRVGELDGYSTIGHGGAVYGFSSQLEAVPERNIGVVAVASLDGSNGVVSRLTNYALRWMLAAQDGDPLVEYPTSLAIAPERASVIVGHYKHPESGEQVSISENAGVVSMRKGAYQVQIRCSSQDGSLVADDVAGPELRLSLESPGKLGINDLVYEREEDRVPDDIAEEWRGLIGEYGLDHNVLYVLEEEGQLTVLIEWLYYYPLRQIDKDTYQFPNDGLYHGEQVKFLRDESGRATHLYAAGIRFDRRKVEPENGATFQIQPIRPLEVLRDEAMVASPPQESGTTRMPELQEVTTIEPSILLDIRYATHNNFTGEVFYRQPRAFLQLPAAQAVARVHQSLKSRGVGLLIHDAYRPWYVTKMFWEATPKELRDFVANPARGSRHNRGCAVDLTLFDLESGNPIEMVSGYDEFTPRAYPQYPGGTSRQRYYRDLLRQEMAKEGFTVYEKEWWHFDFSQWNEYGIQNTAFEALSDTSSANPEVVFQYPAVANGALSYADGFRGIWYMNQPSKDEYVYKYSGGMATYPWQHHPIAIFRPEVNKTFFVYGGRYQTRNSLLHCVSYYDHATGLVARPRVLLDKKTDDAHDNPTLCIDDAGFVFVFSSAHGVSRPAYIHRSRKPYEIDEFDCVATTNFSYPQPWKVGDLGMLMLHTRYAGGRVLHAMNSLDGESWSEPRVLAHIDEGHYQVSQIQGNRVATAFNFHPKGKGLNHRTNLYYMESYDAGQTWVNARGEPLRLPLTEIDNPAIVVNMIQTGRLCYMRCVRFNADGQPVILFVTSGGYQSGPKNDPRQLMTARWTGAEWELREAMQCDNNYDFADLEIRDDGVWQISGVTEEGPQAYNTGGEMAIWTSHDEGQSWLLSRRLTVNSQYNHNFPRIPLNAQRDFYLLWADGHARHPSDSALYYTDQDGSAIWKLPTELSGNEPMVQPLRFKIGDPLR